MWCFYHFDLEMCFAPEQRALFRHLNFQKRSERGVLWTFNFETCFALKRRALFRNLNFQKCSECQMFCTFWLRNVLRTTTACTFVTSQLPKVLRMWGVFSFFTYTCASHHNGLHFFDIAISKSAPKLKSFVHLELEMCFAPQRRAIFHLLSGQLAPHPPL